MKTTGVICEFNPFHNGHEYLLKKIRENGAGHVAVCMSGNFTQRGVPAIYDKYTRTKAALSGGADLVIELPVSFACAGAERFAYGGVSLLNSLGCLDEISFGSECADINALKKLSEIDKDADYSNKLREYLSEGMTFAAARQAAAQELYGAETAGVLSCPNDILAAEYLKAIKKLNSSLEPFPVKRIGAEHDSDKSSGNIASAKHIRSLIYEGIFPEHFMPSYTQDLFAECEDQPPRGGRLSKLEQAIMYRLRTMDRQEIADLPEIREGLENKLYSVIKNSTSLNEIITGTKSKRYTRARIVRIIMYAFLGIKKDELSDAPKYIRVLGFNSRGKEILRMASESAKLPIIMRYGDVRRLDDEARRMYELESRCDDIYALSGQNAGICGRNMTEKMIVMN